MKLVSPFLRRIVYPSLSRSGYFRRTAPAGVAVVTYHGVLPEGYRSVDSTLDKNLVTAGMLRQQLRMLKQRYHVIRPEEFRLWQQGKQELPSHSVLLTCDDGLKNHLTEMVPILQEMDLQCIFFVTGGSLEKVPGMLWYERLYLMFLAASKDIQLDLEEIKLREKASQHSAKRALWWKVVRKLSAFELQDRQLLLDRMVDQLKCVGWDAPILKNSGSRQRFLLLDGMELSVLAKFGMCIGAHTLSHPVLSQTAETLAREEISESRQCLGRKLNTDIWALAYPFGDSSSVSTREFSFAASSGFDCAFINEGGGFGSEMSRFALPRVHVTADMNVGTLEAQIVGFHRRLQELFSRT